MSDWVQEALPAHSWDRLVQPGGYTVTGGAGGISVSLSELMRGAYGLEQLAEEVRSVSAELEQISAQLTGTGLTAVGAEVAARLAVADAAGGMAAEHRQLLDTAVNIRTACSRYAEAEESAVRRILGAGGSLRNFELRNNRFSGAGSASGSGPRSGPGRGHPVVTEEDAWYHFGDEIGGWLFTEAAEKGLFVPGPITWTRRSESVLPDYDGRLSSLLERNELGRIIDGSAEPGVIEVLKIEDAGAPRFVVTLPGTQGMSPLATENPLDPAGISEAMAADSKFMTASVMRALADSGASTGDPVLLSGHSQGGMHAHSIAADPAFLARFDPQYVVSAGSPVANMPLPERTTALSLEQDGDPVHGLDFRDNPDARNRVTVNFSSPPVRTQGSEPGLLDAHRASNYAQKAVELEESGHISVAPVVRGIAAFAPAGAKVTSYKFTGTRRPGQPVRAPGPRKVPGTGPPPGAPSA